MSALTYDHFPTDGGNGGQCENQPPAVDLLGSNDTRGSGAGGARASGP